MYKNEEKFADEEKTGMEIRAFLDEADKKIKVNTPGMDSIRRLVDKVEDKKQKKNNLQFLVFIIVAAFAISFEILTYSRISLNMFFVVQGVALTCIPAALKIMQLRKRRQVEGL